jgi:DNA-binding response OmpR family regulator
MSTVLVADDDDDIRHLIGMKLRRAGYTVEVAGDGVEALELARRTRPDLIVLDVMMPGKSGIEVTRELASDTALRQVPILLLTALASSRDISDGLEAGAAAYFQKPFSPSELLDRVEELLRATTLDG